MPYVTPDGGLIGVGTHPCLICGKTDENKAMCFRGEDWCCELHRKAIERRRLDRLLLDGHGLPANH